MRPESSLLVREIADDLLRLARASLQLAYAPYSGFRVGAALLASDHQVFAGANVENASYGLSLCAERVALAKAVSSGARGFVALAIASEGPRPTLPCGACRQFLFELAPDLVVLSQGASGERAETTLAELLPRPFGPADLS